MSRTGPRLKFRKGSNAPCARCGSIFYSHPSCPRTYCGAACYHAAQGDAKKTICAKCGERPRAGGQSYCKPCGLEANAAWRQANRPPESGIARSNVRVEKTPEQKRLEKNAGAREYRKKNMDKVLMWNRIRRHRERSAGKLPHPFDIGWLMCHQDARCTYCRILFAPGVDYEIDHKTPVSRGGTNDLENLQLLCPTCNMKKSTKTHEEYLERFHGLGQRAFERKYKTTEAELLALTLERLA